MRLHDRLTEALPAPTPAEARVLQVLLNDYPLAGLGTAAQLARRAAVSDPTVARLVVKLGYRSFAEFQGELLAEIEARIQSPLTMMEAKRPAEGDVHPVTGFLDATVAGLSVFQQGVHPAVYDQVEQALMEATGRVYLQGGRFSRFLAGVLAGHLHQMRPGVIDLGPCSAESFDRVIDMGRADVLVVFDYRRYQTDVVRLAEQAAERGVRVVLFTDPWMSPIAAFAALVLVAPVEAGSPYDSLLPPLAQVEALSALIAARRGERIGPRLTDLEDVRARQRVTLGAEKAGSAEA